MKAHEPKRSILLKFVSYAMLMLAKKNYLTVIPNIAMSLYDIKVKVCVSSDCQLKKHSIIRLSPLKTKH